MLNPVDAHSAPGAITTIVDDRFEVTTVSGEVLLEGRFFLDGTTVPKSITWVDAIGEDAGKHLPASYHLAVTMDDAADGVTLVTRGADLFAASHVHRTLQALLGLPVPRWHHHPLLTDETGQKLAKRRGSPFGATSPASGARSSR